MLRRHLGECQKPEYFEDGIPMASMEIHLGKCDGDSGIKAPGTMGESEV